MIIVLETIYPWGYRRNVPDQFLFSSQQEGGLQPAGRDSAIDSRL